MSTLKITSFSPTLLISALDPTSLPDRSGPSQSYMVEGSPEVLRTLRDLACFLSDNADAHYAIKITIHAKMQSQSHLGSGRSSGEQR